MELDDKAAMNEPQTHLGKGVVAGDLGEFDFPA
jgi:hypothetical protein